MKESWQSSRDLRRSRIGNGNDIEHTVLDICPRGDLETGPEVSPIGNGHVVTARKLDNADAVDFHAYSV